MPMENNRGVTKPIPVNCESDMNQVCAELDSKFSYASDVKCKTLRYTKWDDFAKQIDVTCTKLNNCYKMAGKTVYTTTAHNGIKEIKFPWFIDHNLDMRVLTKITCE